MNLRCLLGWICLTLTWAHSQATIDTTFARKLYSAGPNDLFRVHIGLKNTAYWLLNDTLRLDKPVFCDKTKQDCSPAAFQLKQVFDTVKTDAFFKRHEILNLGNGNARIEKPTNYQSHYSVNISPYEVLQCLGDTVVMDMVELGEASTAVVLPLGMNAKRKLGDLGPRIRGQRLLGRADSRR